METTRPLPSARSFITSLIDAISKAIPVSSDTDDPLNPLSAIPTEAKPYLITLHALFHKEFLPALDLLDRRLITRLTLPPARTSPRSSSPSLTPSTQQDAAACRRHHGIYIVKSAQPARHSHHGAAATSSSSAFHGASTSLSRFHDALAVFYEVRTGAWNCTCPAFAFGAHPAGGEGELENIAESEGWTWMMAREEETHGGESGWSFGGVSRGLAAPTCKHLLACVLVERVDALARCLEHREVSLEEMAGWSIG